MKSILTFLATLSFISVGSVTTLACGKGPAVGNKPEVTPKPDPEPEPESEFHYGSINDLFLITDLGEILVTPELTRPNVPEAQLTKLVQRLNDLKLDWDKLDLQIYKNRATISAAINQDKYHGEAVDIIFKVMVDINEAVTLQNVGSVSKTVAGIDLILLHSSIVELEKINPLFHPESNDPATMDKFEVKENNQTNSFILVAKNNGDYTGEIKIYYDVI